MAWAVLVVISFFIPNSFFIIWANYFAMAGSVLFILYGLILLIDAAHSWAEMCLERYEATESRRWELVLVGSTFGMYAGALAMVVISYIFFARSGCGLNQTFLSLNLVFAVLCTGMAIHPRIQEANSRSGLAQSAMVCIYATYLTLSAVCNGTPSSLARKLTILEPDNPRCNPLSEARGSRTAMVILGAMFTFLAIAYSTTRAATQGSSIGTQTGNIQLSDAEQGEDHTLITTEPSERRQMRTEALRAAVEAGYYHPPLNKSVSSEDTNFF
jgi:serine incorporator 1/3